MDARQVLFKVQYKEGNSLVAGYKDDLPTHNVRLMLGRGRYSSKAFDLSSVPLQLMYTQLLRFAREKIKDLKDLLHFVTPHDNKEYFRKIFREQEDLSTSQREDPVQQEEKVDRDDHLQEYE